MARQGVGQIVCNEKVYRSQKHPLLEYIFLKYNPNKDKSLKSISFTLADISEAYRSIEVFRIDKNGNKMRIQEPASISNTILDLVRQNRGIRARIPDTIIDLGYDLRKKTGGNSAGEFVFVGKGNELNSWITWPPNPTKINIDTNPIPSLILNFLRKDEGALFSVIDYCDLLSQALYGKRGVVFRVQHPLKWQPNEIDGLYAAIFNNVVTLFPIEAKALTTHDEINLDQILGGVNTISTTLQKSLTYIVPMAVKMIPNGILLATFSTCVAGKQVNNIKVERTIEIVFTPPICSWQ